MARWFEVPPLTQGRANPLPVLLEDSSPAPSAGNDRGDATLCPFSSCGWVALHPEERGIWEAGGSAGSKELRSLKSCSFLMDNSGMSPCPGSCFDFRISWAELMNILKLHPFCWLLTGCFWFFPFQHLPTPWCPLTQRELIAEMEWRAQHRKRAWAL